MAQNGTQPGENPKRDNPNPNRDKNDEPQV